jgi:colicin import membrane protein
MSTLKPTVPPSVVDPFRYGWRDINRRRPDGTIEWEQIPLTLEDVLHPQEGDVILESTQHDRNVRYLADVLSERLSGDPGALVLRDCGVYWDIAELRHHSPDVAVILGLRSRRPQYASFNVAEEGVRPAILIEHVSPSTRSNDVDTKVDHYHRARVPQYVIIDCEDDEDTTLRLIDYRWTPDSYREEPADARGRVPLLAVNLYLGVEGRRAVLFDSAGKELGDYEAISSALRAEAAARLTAEGLVEAERARAEAERERADAEAASRRSAEDRLRAAEAELRRLRGES